MKYIFVVIHLVIFLSIINVYKTSPALIDMKTVRSTTNGEIMPPGDSFKANKGEGWSAIQSYVYATGDSIQFEVLLRKLPNDSTDWARTSQIGKIDDDFAPSVRTDFEFREPTRTWAVIITPKGKCYVRWIGGEEPSRSGEMYLPLKTIFKR